MIQKIGFVSINQLKYKNSENMFLFLSCRLESMRTIAECNLMAGVHELSISILRPVIPVLSFAQHRQPVYSNLGLHSMQNIFPLISSSIKSKQSEPLNFLLVTKMLIHLNISVLEEASLTKLVMGQFLFL